MGQWCSGPILVYGTWERNQLCVSWGPAAMATQWVGGRWLLQVHLVSCAGPLDVSYAKKKRPLHQSRPGRIETGCCDRGGVLALRGTFRILSPKSLQIAPLLNANKTNFQRRPHYKTKSRSQRHKHEDAHVCNPLLWFLSTCCSHTHIPHSFASHP